jgi:hypothetical protein
MFPVSVATVPRRRKNNDPISGIYRRLYRIDPMAHHSVKPCDLRRAQSLGRATTSDSGGRCGLECHLTMRPIRALRLAGLAPARQSDWTREIERMRCGLDFS